MTNCADDLRQIGYAEQAIFLAVWHLNPRRNMATPMVSLVKEFNSLMQRAMRNFEREESCLRVQKPLASNAHRAAHARILKDLDTLRVLLHDGAAIAAFDFERALAEFLVHCVCNDPWTWPPAELPVRPA